VPGNLERDRLHEFPGWWGLERKIRPAYPAELLGNVCRVLPFGEEHQNSDRYLAWLRDFEVIRTLNLPAYWSPVQKDEVRRYCAALRGSENDYFFAIALRETGEFIGTLRAGHIDWRADIADIGIMIGEKRVWGGGIAQDAIATLARWLFDVVEIRRITAGAMAANPAMIHVFEKLGFQQEGVLRSQDALPEGGYGDHILLGCLKSEFVRGQAEALREGDEDARK